MSRWGVRMASLLEDPEASAARIAEALRSSGYTADFTPASLWSVDRFFDDHSQNGQPTRGGLLSDQLGQRIFAVGAYVGEVIRRNVGGTWNAHDDDPQGEINV